MLSAYFSNVVWLLPHCLKDIDGGRHVDVLEVSHCVCVCSRKLHLCHFFHHFRLKLGVHRPRLDQRQPVG